MKKVIYIAGYGRSGSTILSILMDNLPGVVGVGEIASLHDYLGVTGRECSCNRDYCECDVWGKVLERLPGQVKFIKKLRQLQYEIEPWNKCWCGCSSSSVEKEYARRVSKLFKVVSNVTGGDILVDSSKSVYAHAWRALSISRLTDIDITVVHLLRNVKEVVSSRKKGRNIDLETGKSKTHGSISALIGLGGWVTANLTAYWIRKYLGSDKSLVVDYEKLVHSPNKELQRIVSKSNIESSITKNSNLENLEVGHMIGGNRLARENKFIKIRPQKNNIKNLSEWEKNILSIVKMMSNTE